MAKPLPFDEIKKRFEDRGYILVSTSCKNSKEKLKYICPKHPDKENWSNYNNITKGQGCPYCAGRGVPEWEDIVAAFESAGYTLLDDRYVNATTPLRYRCPHHPDKDTRMTYANIRHGRRCPYCAKKAKHTIEDVRKEFASRGYELLSDSYKDAKTPLYYRCPNHPEKELYVRYSDFLHHGHGCKYCAIDSFTGENHPNWKGGTSTLSEYLRAGLKEWKLRVLREYGFKCAVTGGGNGNFHVHHLSKPFSQIRDEVIRNLGYEIKEDIYYYTIDELRSMREGTIKAHETVEGVPLEDSVHKLLHHIYGVNPSKEDFLEFKERFLRGEFNSLQKLA